MKTIQAAGLTIVLAILLLTASRPAISAPSAVAISPVGPDNCAADCQDMDAIVFVHGIYGSVGTFVNPTSHFDWPAELPRQIGAHRIDVYRLDYQTALLGWSAGKNPSFDIVSVQILKAMTPIRQRKYRSINFIAHSLGGNFVSTYIHLVVTRFGHAKRAQNGFVITLATPVVGSQIADIGILLKELLGMKDDLLSSLQHDELYLRMLNEFRASENEKSEGFECRAVTLHAAYEQRRTGPLLIVDQGSAARPVENLVRSPLIGFPVNHSEIAKPFGIDDPIYAWALSLIESELDRLDYWDFANSGRPMLSPFCRNVPDLPDFSLPGSPNPQTSER